MTKTRNSLHVRHLRLVGVVPDIKHSGPQESGRAQMYILPDVRPGNATLRSIATLAMVMRVRGGGVLAHDRLKQIAESIGPRMVVGRVRPVSEFVATRLGCECVSRALR